MTALIVSVLIAVTASAVGLATTGLRPRSSQWQSLPVATGFVLALCFLGMQISMVYRIIGAALEMIVVLVFMIRYARMEGVWQSLKLAQYFKNSYLVVYITWAARHIIWLILKPRIRMRIRSLPMFGMAYCIRWLRLLANCLESNLRRREQAFVRMDFT